MENLGFAILFFGAIGLITLITFFIMSSNVTKIKKLIEHKETNINYSKSYEIGELKEFQGKKAEALDSYKEALFYVNKFISKNPGCTTELKNKKTIEDKISTLSGSGVIEIEVYS